MTEVGTRSKPLLRLLTGDSEYDRHDPFTAAEYLQLARMARRTVAIDINAAPSGPQGRIEVRGGELWGAFDGSGEGEEAFRRLMMGGGLDRPGIARCHPMAPPFLDRNLFARMEHLLLDAARAFDEGKVRPAESSETASESVAEPDGTADDGGAAEFEAGVEAVLRKDYRGAFRAFTAAQRLAPDDPRVALNLRRLRELGYGEGAAE